jgi:hypothetical protein
MNYLKHLSLALIALFSMTSISAGLPEMTAEDMKAFDEQGTANIKLLEQETPDQEAQYPLSDKVRDALEFNRMAMAEKFKELQGTLNLLARNDFPPTASFYENVQQPSQADSIFKKVTYQIFHDLTPWEGIAPESVTADAITAETYRLPGKLLVMCKLPEGTKTITENIFTQSHASTMTILVDAADRVTVTYARDTKLHPDTEYEIHYPSGDITINHIFPK